MTQGLVVKYFERTVPCLFTGATIHEVIKIKVVLWCHHRFRVVGPFKDKLKDEILTFETSHMLAINNELMAGLAIHMLNTLSLWALVTFATYIINFISDTYTEYEDAHFNSKKSSFITTKLAIFLICYVALPYV